MRAGTITARRPAAEPAASSGSRPFPGNGALIGPADARMLWRPMAALEDRRAERRSSQPAATPVTTVTRTTWRARAVLLVILAATAWAYRGNLGLGFTDTDALADVAAARVENPRELLSQVWQPLTAGVGEQNANFWRPVAMLHYALLRGLFGYAPLGWHIWAIGLHLFAVVLVFVLMRAVQRPEGEALVGAGILALHPLGVEVVPAVARHIDLVFNVCGLAALVAIARGRVWLAVLAGALAIGAKEVAVVLVPVFVGWALALGRRREALTLTLAFGVLVPLFLWGRSTVLHGLGGYHPPEKTFFLDALGGMRAAFRAGPLEQLFPGWSREIEAWIPLSLGLELSCVLLLAATVGAAFAWRRGQRLSALGLALVCAPLLLYGATAMYSRRLVYLLVIGTSLGMATLYGHRRLRWLLLVWLLTLAPASPLFHPDDDWHRSDAVTRAMTDGLAAELATLPQGAVVNVLDLPARLNHDPRRRMLWRNGFSLNHALASYSFRAWIDDRLGRDDLELRFLDHSAPFGWLDEPEVAVEGDRIRVRRPPLERGWARWMPTQWEVTTEGSDVLLRRREPTSNEWLLVAGAPRSRLVRVP